MLTVKTYPLEPDKSKELITSLNYMLNAIKNKMVELNKSYNNILQFQVSYDNGSYFEFLTHPNSNQLFIIYSNEFGVQTNELSLQEALNLNKYALEIQTKMRNNNLKEYQVYYTEQNINKFIAIYNEHNKEERHFLHKNYEEFIRESPEEELEL